MLISDMIITSFLLSYRNASGSLGEREVVGEHEAQAIVLITAFFEFSQTINFHKCF